MAKKKKTIVDENIVSNDSLPKAYNILNSEDVLMRDMVFDLRDKGFDTNRIAARLEIRKDIVENILNT